MDLAKRGAGRARVGAWWAVSAGIVPGLTAGLAMAPAGCSTNPATGKSVLTLLSSQEEISLGAQAAPGFTKEYGGPVPDAELQRYVTAIGTRLAAQTEGDYPGYPWEFTLLNSDVVNAFALPGGKVFFTRGLASRLTNEAQMAGVLGHEVGHVTAQHGNQRISQQALITGVLTATAVVVESSGNQRVRDVGSIGVPALAVGGQLVMLSYGRKEELQSDGLGVRYMSKVGYDPKGQMQVMQVLQSLGGNRGADIFSTHPDPAARVEQIQGMLQGEYAFTQNSPQHQLYEERYRTQFLARLKALPPAPDAKAVATLYGELGPPSAWCGHCIAAAAGLGAPLGAASGLVEREEAGPVAPRKGVYAFIAPAAR